MRHPAIRPIVGLAAALAVVLAAVPAAADHPGTWTRASDMPEPRDSHGAVVVDGLIYIVGGFGLNMVPLTSVWAYDPVADEWTQKADLPTQRGEAAVAVADGRIVVIGGFDWPAAESLDVVEIYDPAADVWTTGAPMPTPRGMAAAAGHGGSIYVFGGTTGALSASGPELVAAVEVYDVASDAWSAAPDMPTPRARPAAIETNQMIWVTGGIGGSSPGWTSTLNTVERFHPATGMWFDGDPLDHPRAGHTMVVIRHPGPVGFDLYVLGGYDYYQNIASIERLTSNTDNRWHEFGRMPQSIWVGDAAVLDDAVYFAGGVSPAGTSSAMLLRFDPKRYTYWAEIAAHLGGAFGSLWRTDVAVTNDSDEQADLEVVLHAAGAPAPMTATVAPHAQLALEDVVGQMGVTGKGMLEVRSSEPLRVVGRIFNDDAGATFGQLCDLQASDHGLRLGDVAYLVGLRQQQGLFRTNLTFSNTGLWDATVEVKLFDADGLRLVRYLVELAPGDAVQDLEPFANHAAAPNVGWGYATATITAGHGVFVSASVVDSQTNDATTVYPKD